jgi:hypothetical protein
MDVEVYSKKMQTWVTITIPEILPEMPRHFLRTLIKEELAKREAEMETSQIPVTPKETRRIQSGIEARNRWIRSIDVSVSVPSILISFLRDD